MYKRQRTEGATDPQSSVGSEFWLASSPVLVSRFVVDVHIVIEEIQQVGWLPVWVADPSGTVERMLVCPAVAREATEVGWP